MQVEQPPRADVESVVVAVLTYRRPDDLAAILPELVRQATLASRPARVLVVDNDPEAAARQTVVEGWPDVQYVHEPRPGIAAARNRALAEAGRDDLLVFVDDDERPVPDWLDLLLAVWVERRCAAVVGPVVSEFAVEPSAWVSAGRFFDRRRLPTGTAVQVAATNNLLLDLAQVRSAGLTFDERFGLSGGSDTLFTRQLHESGGAMLWCDEALVVDVVPAARVERRWVLARAFRSGNGWTRTSLQLSGNAAGRLGVRVRLLGAGAVRVLGGGARALVGLVRRDVGDQARGVRTLARGAGMVAGTWGYVYSEYKRP
ncbi:glycosyltransferase family 2 protein [Angustibacter luteus]|uniref:Glycosyltransferase family 2 protein n=1 Tax=Angustibacter luteus TaxID=658456 RepID=A0ABW1JBH6_9ACTN